MKKATDTGEIYLLSLDTFMLLAVMGITIGLLFIVVNPTAKLNTPEPEKIKQVEIFSRQDFDNITTGLPVYNSTQSLSSAVRSLQIGVSLQLVDNTYPSKNRKTLRRFDWKDGSRVELVIICELDGDEVTPKLYFKDENKQKIYWENDKDNALLLKQLRKWKGLDKILIKRYKEEKL